MPLRGTLSWNYLTCKIRLYKYYPYVGYWWCAHADGGWIRVRAPWLRMRSLHLSHCSVRHCSRSLALSWLRSGSRVVNEQRLTVCIIGAVYRERLPLAAGSWHTLHLPPAKAEWNHTQGGRTERTSSTGLIITIKCTSQREKGTRLRRFSISFWENLERFEQ